MRLFISHLFGFGRTATDSSLRIPGQHREQLSKSQTTSVCCTISGRFCTWTRNDTNTTKTFRIETKNSCVTRPLQAAKVKVNQCNCRLHPLYLQKIQDHMQLQWREITAHLSHLGRWLHSEDKSRMISISHVCKQHNSTHFDRQGNSIR